MKKLITLILLIISLSIAAQIGPVTRYGYKDWQYHPQHNAYMNGDPAKPEGWLAIQGNDKRFDPYTIVYVGKFAENEVRALMQYLSNYCPDCKPLSELTYLPSYYSIGSAKDVYSAALYGIGYVVWYGDAKLGGDRVQIAASIQKDEVLLFLQFYK